MCIHLLHMAQVYGRTISSTLNADTGKIIEQLSYGEPGDLVAFPDDLIFGSDGTMYYTDPAYFQTVFFFFQVCVSLQKKSFILF